MTRKGVRRTVAGLLLMAGGATLVCMYGADRRRALHGVSSISPAAAISAPPQPTVAQHEDLAKPARQRVEEHRATEDRQLAEILSSTKRMTSLPDWVGRVYVDPAGTAWFESGSSGGDEEASLRRSVEDAFAGKTRIIRGKIWLVDSHRRIWVSRSDGRPASILCYDGQGWNEHAIPAGRPNDTIDVYPHAWEDSTGNVWFVILDRSVNECRVDRFGADGSALETVVPNPAGRAMGALWEEPVLTESPRGTPAFYSARVDPSNTWGASSFPRVYRFADNEWNSTLARMCWDHPTDYVMPLADGRILTICGDKRLFICAAPSDQDLARWMSDLDDPDPAVRESASASLNLLGPEHIERIRKGIDSAATPGGQLALSLLLDRLQKQMDSASEPSGIPHPPTMQCDGFSFSAVRYVGTDPRGGFVLDVDDYRASDDPRVIRRALVTYARAAKRSVKPLPQGWPSGMFDSNTVRDDILIGRDGSIWLRDGRRYKDGAMADELPKSLGREVKQDDADGHLYCGRTMVINLAAAAEPTTKKATKLTSSPSR